MSDDGNGGQKPKPANFMRWFYTVVIVVAGLCLVLFNPDNIVYNPDDALEEVDVGSLGWFPTYPGQSAALQILGTFIAAVGAVVPLLDTRIRGIVSIPLGVLIAAVIGPILIIAGQVIQGMKDNPLVLVVVVAMSAFVILIWILAAAVDAVRKWGFPWLQRVYSWLKSRFKSGG